MNINRSSVFLSCDKNGGSFKLGLDVDRRCAFCCFYRWLPSDTLELYLNVSLLPDHFDAHSKPINNIHAVISTTTVKEWASQRPPSYLKLTVGTLICSHVRCRPSSWLCLLSTSTFSTGASRSSDVLPSSAERPPTCLSFGPIRFRQTATHSLLEGEHACGHTSDHVERKSPCLRRFMFPLRRSGCCSSGRYHMS